MEKKVSVIEQCLAFGGERRLRLQLTVSTGGNESLYEPSLDDALYTVVHQCSHRREILDQ